MDDYDVYQALNLAIRKSNDAREQTERELAKMRATVDELLHILVAKGVLGEGHERLIQRVAERAGSAVVSKIRLRQFVDKYTVPHADIDCGARMHLCKGRCCSLSFDLSVQDLDEGKVHWEIEQPYMIRHDRDGLCSHMDRKSGGCGVYEVRPAVCRSFDCRGDARIWIDFEGRIPAPIEAPFAGIE